MRIGVFKLLYIIMYTNGCNPRVFGKTARTGRAYNNIYVGQHHRPMTERGLFSGKRGFILATAASAVGLGNIWRFPTEAASHGGGTFLIVYLVIVLVFGLVMMVSEVALGRRTGKSPIDAYGSLHRKSKIIGVLSVWVPAIILPYYCVIGGWLIGYMTGYTVGTDVYNDLKFLDFAGSDWALVGFLVFTLLMAAVVYRGVSKGIEKISIVFMPAFLVLLVILTVYVSIQPGMMDGIAYYLKFDWEHVDKDTFISALGQAFFSLSIAMGILITYGSYFSKKESIEKSSVSVIVIDTAVAIIAGLLIVPMAYSQTGGDMTGGAGLVFITLPGIFETMAGGTYVAILFFVMITFAALTSAISVIEAVTSTVIDRFRISRRRAVVLIVIPTLIVGSLICLGYGPLDFLILGGMNLLDLFDYVSNDILMPLVALMMCIFIGHVLGPKVIVDEIESSDRFRIKKIYPVMIKWVCPILVAIIFITSLGLY